MNPREVVIEARNGHLPPYVPWSFRFTHAPLEMLCAHYGIESKDVPSAVGNHIVEMGSLEDDGLNRAERLPKESP